MVKLRSLIPIVVILSVVALWFSPWWIGGKNLAPLDLANEMMSPWRGESVSGLAKNHIVSDGVDQYLVYRMLAAESLAKEGWIGWSSLKYGGTAEYANTMALYFDWTIQLHRWFDFWTAWHVGLMCQVMIAATGMFAFLRGREIPVAFAACGGLAYAANSQFVAWIFHRWALGGFCWVPWVLCAIDLYRRDRRWAWGFVPVFLALTFLGGTLQHCGLAALTVVAAWMDEALRLRGDMRLQALRLGRFACWGILGCGLAGMMLVPCTDAFIDSTRLGIHMGMFGNARNGVYPHGLLQPLFNFAAYPFMVFPSVLGRCDSMDVLKLFKSELFYVAYFGSLPVLVAYLAVWRRDGPLLARLLIAIGLLLPLTPLVRLLYQRMFLLFIIGGILAFAHFMTHASRGTRLGVVRWTCRIGGACVLVWSGLSVGLMCLPGVVDKLRDMVMQASAGSTFGYFGDWLASRADNFTGDLFIWSPHQAIPLGLFALGILGLRWSASQTERWRACGRILVVCVVVCEVSLFAWRWVVWTDPAKHPLFPETPESLALREHVGTGNGRVTTLLHTTAHMACTPFLLNTLSVYGIASISGYDSIMPDGMLLPDAFAGNAEKLGRFGVTHLLTYGGNPDVPADWVKVWGSRMMDLYRNPRAMPRYAGFGSSHDLADFMKGSRPEYRPLDETLRMENKRRLLVPRGIGHIRVAENQASGWQYRIDGSGDWVPVGRASDASMLITNPLPDRDVVIEMRYDPPLRRAGMHVTLAALLVTVVGAVAMSRAGTRGKNPCPGN